MNAFIYFWCVWTLPLTQWRTLGVQPSGCRRWRAASEVGRVWGHGPEVQGPHCGPFWSILPSLQPAHLSLVCVCNFPGLAVFSPRAAPLTETRFPSQSQNIEFWWMFLNHFCCFFFFLCLFDFLHLIYTVFKLKHKVFFFFPSPDWWLLRPKYLFLSVLFECEVAVPVSGSVFSAWLVCLINRLRLGQSEMLYSGIKWTFENLPLPSCSPHFCRRLMRVFTHPLNAKRSWTHGGSPRLLMKEN